MARELKAIIFKEMDKAFHGLGGCVLIDYKGINSEQTFDLRASLARGGVEMTVVHNRIARRVFGGAGAPEEFQKLFKGPTAVVYASSDGALTASKTLVEWRKKNKDLAGIKGGLFQGKTLNVAEVEHLATLPGAAQLRQNVLGLFLAPLSFLPTAAQSMVSQFAGCVKAHRESTEKGEAPGGGG